MTDRVLFCLFVFFFVFLTDKQAERWAGRQLLTQLQIRPGVSAKPEGAKLIFIRHDRLKPHLPCHAVDLWMERLPMGRIDFVTLWCGVSVTPSLLMPVSEVAHVY